LNDGEPHGLPEIVDVVAADGTGAGGVEGADVDDDDDDEDDDEDEDEDDDDDGVRGSTKMPSLADSETL